MTTTRTPFHVMTNPTGSTCNRNCTSCFHLEKEKLYPGADRFRMKREVLEAHAQDYIAAQPGPIMSFAWQGGEPTLTGLGSFRRAVDLQEHHAAGRRIANALQTNGTLRDDAWCEFLARERFSVQFISIVARNVPPDTTDGLWHAAPPDGDDQDAIGERAHAPGRIVEPGVAQTSSS